MPLAAGEETRKAINLFNVAMLESSNRYLQFRSGFLMSSLGKTRSTSSRE